MSHSKVTKRNETIYIDKWNPKANKWIVNCAICGTKGFDPSILNPDFDGSLEHQAIKSELIRMYKPLELNADGLCETCAHICNSKTAAK